MIGCRRHHWLLYRFLLQRLLGGAPLARSLASAGEAARPVKRSAEGGPLNAEISGAIYRIRWIDMLGKTTKENHNL